MRHEIFDNCKYFKGFSASCAIRIYIQLTVGMNTTEAAFLGVLTKRCSESMPQIYRRTSMWKCDFKLYNFIKITVRHGCSPVNL